ncbi:mRNA-decapping enzyme 1B isoform X2 [Esox lucius]|uniref:mRNA-decapping enzyme 1B isoform X2 n=1 Tax=Esox lucius TaxID=8010 RepID=UPI0014771951|nr:mRNA-decapping enzyme 1B isoform X2 [Esox lucius]
MTASSSGGNTCLTAKGLDISLAALQRQDPYINNIVDVASQVALYTFNNRSNEWEKTDVEGTLFVYTRLASPRHGFTIMNRLSMENLTEPITKDLDFQLQDPFLLYRNARSIYGIWFYDKVDCQRIAELMKNLTKQEQALAQQSRSGWESPGDLEAAEDPGKTRGVDILQMLTKARDEYDKGGKPEPKEIGRSVLQDNPNLIKPIPVKPMDRHPQPGLQERPVQDQGEPRPLSLATLFGVQQASRGPVSPMSGYGAPGSQPQAKPAGVRPAVARSLSYEDPTQSRLQAQPGAPAPGSGPQQHCPAFQKLMREASTQPGLQRGGPMELLQPVSESPENRLLENGAPSTLHHQAQQDPIQRLFQNQPTSATLSLTSCSSTASCCSRPSPLQQPPHLLPGLQPAQPLLVDPAGFHHHPNLVPHQSQPIFFTPTKASQMQASLPSKSLPPSPHLPPYLQQQVSVLQGSPSHLALQPQPGHPQPGQLAGVVPPGELLQRLQLVQQEQGLVPVTARPASNLAPRFHEKLSAGSAAQKFQVISPQRIPATVAPTLLLSPSVFSQAKPPQVQPKAPGDPPGPPTALLSPRAPDETQSWGLTKSQLQATLLHLIQNDSSFLDTIYKAYTQSFSSKTNTDKF